jgi:Ser/Thr protein kinase RdoA (MazF antagonist)
MPEQAVEIDQTDVAALRACERRGFDATGIALIRRGTNAVYRLQSVPVVVRVAPVSADVEEIALQVGVARWLAAEGVPAVRALDIPQPVFANGRQVTLWESVSDGDSDDHQQYGSTQELGQILRRLHSLPAPQLALPRFQPTFTVRERLSRLDHIEAADRRMLTERADRLADDYARLTFELPHGPIHGDANVGNLLKNRAGHGVLSDLDEFSIGPREWDLVQTAIFTDLYGWHTEAEYQAFVDGYGYDIRTWDGYPVVRDMREISMALWMAGNAAKSEAAAAEVQVRFNSLRTGEGRDRWKPL